MLIKPSLVREGERGSAIGQVLMQYREQKRQAAGGLPPLTTRA